MSTMTTDATTADELTFLADTYVEQWSARLAAGWTPETILWQIENAVDTSPGLGLTFEECEGSCGRWVSGAEQSRRLVLCDACTAEAHAAGEGLMARRSLRGGRLAAQMADQLRDAVLSEQPTSVYYSGHGIGHQYREDVTR